MKKKFDKYHYYSIAVQSPEADIETFNKMFKQNRDRNPKSLKEDFCGAFLICKEWVKANDKNTAIGVDLDPVPLNYGFKTIDKDLTEKQKKRLTILNDNVLSVYSEKVDLTIAVNFSYFIFKTREQLKEYFKSAYKSLNGSGVFLIDCFGGSESQEPNQEITIFKREKFNYIWDQKSFDPISNFAKFEIHFKLKGQKLRKRCFTYDWRMWTIPELREILDEVGFKKTLVYWEGTNKRGGGDGNFRVRKKGEDCQSWIAYLCAIK